MLPSPRSSSFAEYFRHKLILPEEIKGRVDQLRQQGKTIVTLNGSFDLLHAGHLEMIYQASLQGDILLMALNSDSSIKKYKSTLRPIIPLEYRMQMIAALAMVDYVTWFEETDPRDFLTQVKPDIHVNGAEYGESCIESDVVKQGGGRLHIVSLIPGLSTSEIIKKIKAT